MPLNRELILNYAEALYAAASAQGIQHQVREELGRLLAFATHDPEMLRRLSYAFNSARVDGADKATIIETLRKTLELGEMTRDWLAMAAKNGRLNLLPHFIRTFVHEYRLAEGLLLAETETAFPLSSKQQTAIRAALEKVLNASVEMEVTQNPGLIAGLRVRVAGRIWNMSIQGALKRVASRHA